MTVAELIKSLQESGNMDAEVSVGSGAKAAVGDFTGGAAEDLFTLASHGFVDGDQVWLVYESAAGVVTGAIGDTFTVNQLSSSTFQLQNAAGSTIENSADGTAVFIKQAVTAPTGAGLPADTADAPTRTAGECLIG